jgi:chromatin remodeling complex protein RSC6
MSKNTQTKKTKASVTNTPSTVVAETKVRKSTKKEVPVIPSTPVIVPSTTEPAIPTEELETPSKRRIYSRENFLETFDSIIKSTEDELVKENETKTKNGRFLRGHLKQLRSIRTYAARIIKTRTKVKRVTNENSGFKKPVKISKELSKFAGWSENDLHSRVDGTRLICDYVRDHKLQNPDAKREILPDTKLAKLLNYDSKSGDLLTYSKLQKYMKVHYISNKTE